MAQPKIKIKHRTVNPFLQKLKMKKFNQENAVNPQDDVTIDMEGIKKTFNYDREQILNYLQTLEASFTADIEADKEFSKTPQLAVPA